MSIRLKYDANKLLKNEYARGVSSMVLLLGIAGSIFSNYCRVREMV